MATETTRRPPRPRHDRWTAARRQRFLDALSLTANVSGAVRAAKMGRASVYELRKRDAQFAAAWDAALDEAVDDLFAVMMDRAKNGSTRTIEVDGKPVKTIHDYSDKLGMFLLARYRPVLHGRVATARAAPWPPAPWVRPSAREEVDVCQEVARILQEGGV